jgi:hypothetical protein
MSEGLYDEDGVDGPFERRMRRAMREDARRMPVRFAHAFVIHPKGRDFCIHTRHDPTGGRQYCGGRKEEHRAIVHVSTADLQRTFEPGSCGSADCPCNSLAPPWWADMSEYPSPLDVKRLRTHATALLGALKALSWNERGHFSEVCSSLVAPGPCPDFCILARAAVAQAEGRP